MGSQISRLKIAQIVNWYFQVKSFMIAMVSVNVNQKVATDAVQPCRRGRFDNAYNALRRIALTFKSFLPHSYFWNREFVTLSEPRLITI